MLSLRAYLPGLEDHDSLPDTLTDDITIDGENSYVAGIPEELIQPAENSTETNEGDGVITDDNAAMNEQREDAAETEDAGEAEESTTGDSTEDTQGTQEPKPDEEGDTDSEELRKKEEEDEISDVQYAIESYRQILTNGPVSVQAAAFLEVGISSLERRRGIATVSVESYDAVPQSIHNTIDISQYQARCDSIVKSLPIL